MSGFGNKNVRLFEHFVPIFALKSYCWLVKTNLRVSEQIEHKTSTIKSPINSRVKHQVL